MDEAEQQSNLQLLDRQCPSSGCSQTGEGGCHEMLDIYCKTALIWVIRSPAASYDLHRCIPKGRAGAHFPKQSATIITFLHQSFFQEKAMGTREAPWFSMLTILHAIGTRQTSTRDKQCNWRKKIHTNPFSLSLFWKTLPITANKIR